MPILYYSLTAEGPIIDVLIGVSEPRAAALRAAGQAVPQPIRLRMLLDTGASGTCVQSGLLGPLGLVQSGQVSLQTPSTGTTPIQCPQFDVSITLLHPDLSFILGVVPIIECQPLGGTIQGLIGRDVLAHCLFLYHGHVRGFSLAF